LSAEHIFIASTSVFQRLWESWVQLAVPDFSIVSVNASPKAT